MSPYPKTLLSVVFGIGHNFQDQSSVHLNDRMRSFPLVVLACSRVLGSIFVKELI